MKQYVRSYGRYKTSMFQPLHRRSLGSASGASVGALVTAAAGARRTDACATASLNTPAADASHILDFCFGRTSALGNADDLPAAALIRRGWNVPHLDNKAHPTTGIVLLGCSTE